MYVTTMCLRYYPNRHNEIQRVSNIFEPDEYFRSSTFSISSERHEQNLCSQFSIIDSSITQNKNRFYNPIQTIQNI
jgi:hypothetical protein